MASVKQASNAVGNLIKGMSPWANKAMNYARYGRDQFVANRNVRYGIMGGGAAMWAGSQVTGDREAGFFGTVGAGAALGTGVYMGWRRWGGSISRMVSRSGPAIGKARWRSTYRDSRISQVPFPRSKQRII